MPVPHQPPSHLPLASSLPKVSFRRVADNEARTLVVPAGVHDQHFVNYGFNDGTAFEKPEHYLRHVEPIESELNKQVEYDMDEQDQEWLDMVNADRRREQLDTVSHEAFEVIIDRLEKEWFDLMKRVPQKSNAANALGADGTVDGDENEDIPCAICDDGECENSNAIVFCDGCNLAVHQDCYGIPYIPEGQWLCRKCTVSPDRAVSCVLCPHEGGAFKQTSQGKWAHLLCAMWIPETGVSNPVYMEPIDSVERIPKARWKLQCYICRHRVGACIQCDNKNCFTAFHVTCARRAGLLLKTQRQRMAHTPDSDGNEENGEKLRAWCHKHLPKSIRAQRAREEEFQDAHSQPPSPILGSSMERKRNGQAPPATPAHKKSARAYKRSYRPSLSLVPIFVVERVLEYIARLPLRKKQQLVYQVAKFWTLKREARRGAPLLKRLHLEPWTANTSNKEQTEVDRLKTLSFLVKLREDLEKVRMLAELVRKREKEKQRQAMVIRSALVENVFFPYVRMMRAALERIAAIDRSSLFLNPVSKQTVPDYYEIVKNPMDWSKISAKLDDLRYTTLQEFKNDIVLVLENAMLYNKVDTPYHRTAARILHVAGPIFAELDETMAVHGERSFMHLEPEEAILNLLNDQVGDDELQSGEDHPGARVWDALEEITKQSYTVEQGAVSVEKAPKAEKKLSRSERMQLANQKRQEARLRRKAESAAEEATPGEAGGVVGQAADEAHQPSARRSLRGADKPESDSDSRMDTDRDDGRASDVPEPTHLEVNKVDSWDSFKRFNVGWVLPEGSKRSRSKPHPDSVGQSEKRRKKIQQSQSLSSFDGDGIDTQAELQVGDKRKRSQRSSSEEAAPKRRMSRAAQGDQSTSYAVDAADRPQRRASRKQSVAGARHQPPSSKDSHSGGRLSPGKAANISASADFETSTLCWAKMEGHPFFPAEVYDEYADDVPATVASMKPVDVSDQDPVYLVRFFDTTQSFGWVAESKLRLLFEDDELDERMTKASKTSRQRKDVRLALDRAKSLAE